MIERTKYAFKERARYDAAFEQLREIIVSDAPDAEEFRRVLNEVAAKNFPVNWIGKYGRTLLHWAALFVQAARAGLPQVLIDAGADVNARTADGDTPLGSICWWYTNGGAPEYIAVMDALLAAGAQPEPDESWRNDWADPDERARRDWLKVYIDTWPESRAARDRAQDAAPAFDYAL